MATETSVVLHAGAQGRREAYYTVSIPVLYCFYTSAWVDRRNLVYVSVGYIPVERDIRPITSLGEGQCLSGAKQAPKAKPKAFRGFTKEEEGGLQSAFQMSRASQCTQFKIECFLASHCPGDVDMSTLEWNYGVILR